MSSKESFVIISGSRLKNKHILLKGAKSSQTLQLTSRRPILGLFIRNLRLEYLVLNPNFLAIAKIAIERIISLYKQNGLRNTFDHIYAYKVSFELPSGEYKKPIDFEIVGDTRPTWVSRVAILAGVTPFSLNHSQEYDFARFQEKFSCFVWGLGSKIENYTPNKSFFSALPESQEIHVNELNLSNNLSFQKLESASVFHSRTIVADGKVIPSDLHNFIDGSWPSDFVFKINDKFFLFGKDILPDEFDGNFVFFGTSTSWFHFLIEIFPRYLRYDRKELRIRRPVVEEGVPTQILEVLSLVTQQKPLELKPFQHAKFNDLVVCTEARYPFGLDLERRSADIQLVRSFFVSEFKLRNVKKNQLIFITRNRSLFRRSDLVHTLAEFCSNRGFNVVETGDLSMQQQIDLFASATLIVGETGSSLTNLIFCSPGTKIIEINLHGFMAGFFGDFCKSLDLVHAEIKALDFSDNGVLVEIGEKSVDFMSFIDLL